MGPNRLKHFRVNAGLSVAELAAEAVLSADVIYRIEAGRGKGPALSTMTKLATALGVDEDKLFPMPTVKPKKTRWAPSDMTWDVILACPKCRERFRVLVSEGTPEPGEGVVCPYCGFTQVIALRRGS